MSDLVERLVNRSENSRVFHSDRTLFAEAAEAITTLRTELAEQARLNGMGSEREARLMAEVEEMKREKAEAYRRGVEDAAKVAENLEADDYGVSMVDYAAWCQGTFDAARAIRELTAKDGEEGNG